MKADYDDDPPGFETIRQCPAERGFKLLQLAVDGDPQGLKKARGGMAVAREPPAA